MAQPQQRNQTDVPPPVEGGFDSLIPVINKLQEVFNTIGGDKVDLPEIVVIGSQSSGKSSVLEAICGRDFLPRGTGIVTRRPLVLQLINIPKDASKNDKFVEWGEFLHKPKEMFYDFNLIRAEIEADTERIAGDKGVSSKAIHLTIYSPYVVNLTLVDLPGMTKVALHYQPQDIAAQIRAMTRKFIERKRTIILAVTAANTDLANSDALQLAKEVDPEGLRTIGVMTKIDIMDKGTDALDLLCGRVIPLKLGFIGVVNRSQHDIMTKKPIRAALKDEAAYFNGHPLYRAIASRLGTPFLTKTLNKILMMHIRDCLPDLKLKINKMISKAQNELRGYGDSMFESKKGALLLQIITKFSTDYRDAIDGKCSEISTNELYGGARINYIFMENFTKCLYKILPNDGLSLNDIRTAIKNATGPRASLFVPEGSFEMLVRRQIQRLEEPSLQCCEQVYDELQTIVSKIESKELVRFNMLRERIVEVVNDLLHKCKMPTRKMINNLIFIELAYINTGHPDFVGGGGAISKIFEKMAHAQKEEQMRQQQPPPNSNPNQGGRGMPNQPQQNGHPNQGGRGMPNQPQQSSPQSSNYFGKFFGGNNASQSSNQQPQRANAPPRNQPQAQQRRGPPPNQHGNNAGRTGKLDTVPTSIKASSPETDKEKFETELIQNLLASYFDIVRKNVQDTIPKSIMYFLVNSSKENIQNELVRALYKEELFEELLEEAPLIASRRKACKQMLSVLKKAADVLKEVRDYKIDRNQQSRKYNF